MLSKRKFFFLRSIKTNITGVYQNKMKKYLLIGDLQDFSKMNIHNDCEDLGIVNGHIFAICLNNVYFHKNRSREYYIL